MPAYPVGNFSYIATAVIFKGRIRSLFRNAWCCLVCDSKRRCGVYPSVALVRGRPRKDYLKSAAIECPRVLTAPGHGDWLASFVGARHDRAASGFDPGLQICNGICCTSFDGCLAILSLVLHDGAVAFHDIKAATDGESVCARVRDGEIVQHGLGTRDLERVGRSLCMLISPRHGRWWGCGWIAAELIPRNMAGYSCPVFGFSASVTVQPFLQKPVLVRIRRHHFVRRLDAEVWRQCVGDGKGCYNGGRIAARVNGSELERDGNHAIGQPAPVLLHLDWGAPRDVFLSHTRRCAVNCLWCDCSGTAVAIEPSLKLVDIACAVILNHEILREFFERRRRRVLDCERRVGGVCVAARVDRAERISCLPVALLLAWDRIYSIQFVGSDHRRCIDIHRALEPRLDGLVVTCRQILYRQAFGSPCCDRSHPVFELKETIGCHKAATAVLGSKRELESRWAASRFAEGGRLHNGVCVILSLELNLHSPRQGLLFS
mmetsp:Transcript_891/g.2960  ORF Transcript_891/g.2960 Transcript_891/m.2960 type:complete len:489 (-) Transcript_891:1249-2715(-)